MQLQATAALPDVLEEHLQKKRRLETEFAEAAKQLESAKSLIGSRPDPPPIRLKAASAVGEKAVARLKAANAAADEMRGAHGDEDAAKKAAKSLRAEIAQQEKAKGELRTWGYLLAVLLIGFYLLSRAADRSEIEALEARLVDWFAEHG